MNNLVRRTLTGIIYTVITSLSIIYSPLAAAIVFLIFSIVGQFEFLTAFRKDKTPGIFIAILLGTVSYAIITLRALQYIPVSYLGLLAVIPGIAMIAELYRNKKHPWANIAFTLFSVFYISIPLSILNHFYISTNITCGIGYNYIVLLSFFLFIWINDTMAYFTGITLGKHRLFKRVSPKKSWEGFIGGLIFTLIFSQAIAYYFAILSPLQWGLFALSVVIFGTFGDLTESLLKREINIKDSGKILPGHGGILDRLDSVLLASPMVFCCYYFLFPFL